MWFYYSFMTLACITIGLQVIGIVWGMTLLYRNRKRRKR